jgi:hypothetical protein
MAVEDMSCSYCKKEFKRASSLLSHSCEKKRRFLAKDEPGSRLGFHAFLKFYEISTGNHRPRTIHDFINSPYYLAFVKFGLYSVNTKVINPLRFVEYLLKNNKKIDHWCKDTTYTAYLIDYLQVEDVGDALSRAIEYSITWHDKTEHPAKDVLRYGNVNANLQAIVAGRLSPWVLYASDSGQKFLSDLTGDQVAIIWQYIDTTNWQKIIHKRSDDHEYAQDILRQAGW